jgi:CRISPR-associated endonuclease/helicase Cas3
MNGADSGPVDILALWGKTTLEPGGYHPAMFHLYDVGHVARALLAPAGPARFRRVIGAALGVDERSLEEWLPLWVALHDIGKISGAFQRKAPEHRARLEAMGLRFGRDPGPLGHHTLVGANWLSGARHDLGPIDDDWCLLMRKVIGGHHGRFPSAGELLTSDDWLADEPAAWQPLRLQAWRMLEDRFGPSAHVPQITVANQSAAVALLTGFTILCDWIGSDTWYFPAAAGVAIDPYLAVSDRRAREAISRSGFGVLPDDPRRTFRELFPGIESPRPLQAAVDALPAELLQGPALWVIEAPTGEGKTEAALALARRIAGDHADEIYFALPTEATSNQMWMRLSAHFADRGVKLLHSHAFLAEDDVAIKSALDADESADNRSAAQDWFAPRKRALLAPLGVGTVDQAELAALNARHQVLRLLGLAGKVLIIDEVHAYDTYMSSVIGRLLEWLAAVNTSVILLSATLPSDRRAFLLKSFGAKDSAPAPEYPLISVGRALEPTWTACPAASQPHREVLLEWLELPPDDRDDAAEVAADRLLAEVEAGGCAAWICNTVARAQALYLAVQARAPAVPLQVLHSRIPQEDRQRREAEVVERYGPSPAASRPARGIVIGTQVLEQSLDLDFDVLFTDLAPTDLVLQRMGRMHRHRRDHRPARHASPRVIIAIRLSPNGAEAVPGKPDTYVYDEFVLRRSLAVLRLRGDRLSLPGDTRPLIEETYDPSAPDQDGDVSLLTAWREHLAREESFRQEAHLRLVAAPNPDVCEFGQENLFVDGDESGGRWIDIKTRMGDESVTVVPLHLVNGKFCLDADGGRPLEAPVDRAGALSLLRRSMRLSSQPVVRALRERKSDPRPWGDQPLLRDCHPLLLDGGAVALGGRRLLLDPVLGLVIEKERSQ